MDPIYLFYLAVVGTVLLLINAITGVVQGISSWTTFSPKLRNRIFIFLVIFGVCILPYLAVTTIASLAQTNNTLSGTISQSTPSTIAQKPPTPQISITPTITQKPPTPQISITPTSVEQPSIATATDWGLLKGDAISVHKQVTCGVGCPEPLHLRIETIQIDTANDLMIWNVHFLAPTSSSTNGITNVSFPNFDLQSNTTPLNTAIQSINSPAGSMQAKFPFTPVPNEIYTFAVTANYQTITNGIVAIVPKTQSYEPISLSFQP